MTTPAQPDPAAEMRAAAQHVRALSAAAGPGPWKDVPDVLIGGWAVARQDAGPEGPYLADFTRTEHAQWVALMHPGIGVALAEWLDDAADGDEHDEHNPYALAVARALLGGAQ